MYNSILECSRNKHCSVSDERISFWGGWLATTDKVKRGFLRHILFFIFDVVRKTMISNPPPLFNFFFLARTLNSNHSSYVHTYLSALLQTVHYLCSVCQLFRLLCSIQTQINQSINPSSIIHQSINQYPGNKGSGRALDQHANGASLQVN